MRVTRALHTRSLHKRQVLRPMNHQPEQAKIGGRGPNAAMVTAALASITALGLVLRLYRIAEQSVWLDEYYVTVYYGAPDARSFLQLLRLFGPDAMPFGFLPLYWWGRLMGPDSVGLWRLLSVLLGAACIPLLWLIGREIHSNRAGLIAATLLALSPMHLWVSQSIRPNIFIECYALISMLALLKGMHGGRKAWWAIHAASNLLLIWTHIFTVFLIAAEGAYLLTRVRRHPRRLAWWCAVMALIGLSSLVWLSDTLSDVATVEEDFILSIPPVPNLLADWIADDAGHWSDPFLFQRATWPFLPEAVRSVFASAHVYFDAALLVFFAACIVWGIGAVIRGKKGPGIGLMLAVGLLPLGFMLVASLVWRPCVLPRYTSYSSMALYVVAGAAVSAITMAQWRNLIAGLLAIVYAYQLSFTLPVSTRTDWIGVARYIGPQAQEDDLVLVKGTFLAWECYQYNGRETRAPVLPAYTLQAVCEKADRYLSTPDRAHSTVWAVIEPFIYTLPPLESFEKSLLSARLDFERRDFPGMNGLFVYAIRRSADTARAPGAITEIENPTDFGRMLDDIGLGALPPEQREDALRVLRRVVDTEWPPTRFYYSLLAFYCSAEGCPELGVAAARKAVALDPAFPLGHLALAIALGESGDGVGAGAALDKAVRVDRFGYFNLYTPLVEALYGRGDVAAAQREYERLETLGVFLPHAVRARIGVFRADVRERVRLFESECPSP